MRISDVDIPTDHRKIGFRLVEGIHVRIEAQQFGVRGNAIDAQSWMMLLDVANHDGGKQSVAQGSETVDHREAASQQVQQFEAPIFPFIQFPADFREQPTGKLGVKRSSKTLRIG